MADMTDALRQDGLTGANDLFSLDYYMYTYVKADEPYPRHFPDGVFRRMKADEKRWREALTRIYEQAESALHFFDSQVLCGTGDGLLASTWQAIALHYLTVAGEYIDLLDLEKEHDAAAAAGKLQGMIEAREELMRTAERVRIPANAYTYLRIQSIYRQILIDLLAHARQCLAEDKPFAIHLEALSELTGNMLCALR